MKKSRIWVILIFAILVAPILADDFSDLKKKIQKAMKNSEMASSEKKNLIRQLKEFQNEDAVKLCFKIIESPDKSTQKFEAEKEALNQKLKKLMEEQQDLARAINDRGGYTEGQARRYNELGKQIKEIREEKIAQIEDKIRSSSEVKNAALWVLTKMTDSEARNAMLEGLESSKWKIVFACIDAFRVQKWSGAFDGIAALYPASGKPHKESQIRAAVIMALKEIDAESAKDIFIAALKDENWLVKSNAVRALGSIADKDCIGPLIKLLEKEQTGRLKWDIVTILKNITGQDFKDNVSAWRSWWAANKRKFKALKKGDDALKSDDKEEGSHETGAFYGIPIASDHPIFIIDQSGSMQSAADINQARKDAQDYLKKNPGAQGIPPIPPPPGFKSKWEVLQIELKKSIDKLKDKKTDFNIVWYSTAVEEYSKKMVVTSKSSKKKVFAEIKSRAADGMTNIHDALKRAFEIATGQKAGSGGSIWTNDSGELFSDTFFFMTDGYPTEGPVQDMDQIIKLVSEWNATLGIKIHTIGIGIDEQYQSYEFLKTLAEKNNGKFVVHNKEK